jgi:hypothetical protein
MTKSWLAIIGMFVLVLTSTTTAQNKRQRDSMSEVLKRYIRGCNTGDTLLLASTLNKDVKVYFINSPPAEGRETVVKLWKNYHEASHSRWTIDHVVTEGNEAVMEWSALREPRGPANRQFDRGIDWYVFQNGLISEIRQYYHISSSLPPGGTYEQMGFPYKERGYPSREDLDSRLP